MNSTITTLIQPILTQIVIIIIGALGTAALYYVKLGADYLKGKIGADKFAKAKAFVTTLVRSYEQNPVYGNIDGESKKKLVLAAASQFCQTYKLPVTDIMLEDWLEEAVKIMNNDFIEFTTESLQPFTPPAIPSGNTVSVG